MTGLNISVRSNSSMAAMEFRAAAQDMRDLATVRALNKVAEQAITATAKEMRRVGYGLKAATIKKALRIKRAAPGNLKATIVASGRPIPLVQFSARQTAKGVSVNVLNGRKVIAGAFIATMPSGHRGVFVREDGGSHKKVNKGGKVQWHQLPIRELYGPSVPDGVSNAQVQQALQLLVAERFPSILAHESAWLKRKGGR